MEKKSFDNSERNHNTESLIGLKSINDDVKNNKKSRAQNVTPLGNMTCRDDVNSLINK